MRAANFIGRHGRAWQGSLDELSMSIIADACQRLRDFTGNNITASAVVRFAIIEELGELLRVLDDLGEADKRDLKDKLMAARTCRPARKET